VGDGDFRGVARRPRLLDLLVEPDGVDRARSAPELHFQVAAGQHELHQFAHADGQVGFHDADKSS